MYRDFDLCISINASSVEFMRGRDDNLEDGYYRIEQALPVSGWGAEQSTATVIEDHVR